mgnify:CR=1 FL=1
MGVLEGDGVIQMGVLEWDSVVRMGRPRAGQCCRDGAS